MKITKFGLEILWKADYYLRQGCIEEGDNIVFCAGNPKRFNNIAQGKPYCAAFVSQVIKDALNSLGRKLGFDFGSSAVIDLYNQAYGRTEINQKPMPGAIAIIKTGSTTSKKASNGEDHSHAMIVRDVSDDFSEFWTTEGNTSKEKVEGVFSIKRPSSNYSVKDYRFIHIQDYFADLRELVDNPLALFKKENGGGNNNGGNTKKPDDILATNLVSVRNEYR